MEGGRLTLAHDGVDPAVAGLIRFDKRRCDLRKSGRAFFLGYAQMLDRACRTPLRPTHLKNRSSSTSLPLGRGMIISPFSSYLFINAQFINLSVG